MTDEEYRKEWIEAAYEIAGWWTEKLEEKEDG